MDLVIEAVVDVVVELQGVEEVSVIVVDGVDHEALVVVVGAAVGSQEVDAEVVVASLDVAEEVTERTKLDAITAAAWTSLDEHPSHAVTKFWAFTINQPIPRSSFDGVSELNGVYWYTERTKPSIMLSRNGK